MNERWDNAAPHRPAPETGPGSIGRPIRVSTDADVVINRVYSYWPNAWVSGETAYVFFGTEAGPRFVAVDLRTGSRLAPVPPLVTPGGTSEGWYWNADGRLYYSVGPRLLRSGEDEIVLDIAASHPGCRIWQAHSSEDGRVHSATVERITNEGPYERIGTVLQVGREQRFYGALQPLDESQISKDGAFLLIKEGDDNRIITVATGEERWIQDTDGAVGHSDMGAGIVIGEDNIHGACVMWDLLQDPPHRSELFKTWAMGHVSVRGNRVLHSNATHLALVAPSGARTELLAHGMTGDGYDYQVRANLSPCGRVAFYLTNVSGRMDAFLLPLQ